MSCCGILVDGSCPSESSGGGGVTSLQGAYNGSTSPQIVLSSSPGTGELLIQDNATPIGTNLFAIQNNGGSTNYFSVSSTATSIVGKLNVTGLIDPEGLVLDGQASVPGGNPGSNKGTVWINNSNPTQLFYTDSSGSSSQLGGANSNPLTTKGDLFTYSTINARLPVGTSGYVLMPDTTQTTGLGWRILFTNVIRVDKSGNDSLGALNGLPFLTVTAAFAASSSGDVVLVYPGTYTETAGMTIPSGVALVGISRTESIVQVTGATGATDLLTVGSACEISNLTLNLTSSLHFLFRGIVFSGTNNNSRVKDVLLTVDNSSASSGGTSTVYGIYSNASTSPSESIINIETSVITVNSTGSGNKRGILVDSNAQIIRSHECTYLVTQAAGSGSYVGAEINIAGGTLYLRYCVLNGLTSNYLQTAGTLVLTAVDTDVHQTIFSSQVNVISTTNQLTMGTTNTTTLTAPAPPSSITLTLPSSASDTLVARATVDTLTNKTISAGTLTGTTTISGPTVQGAVVTVTAGTISTNNATATTILSSSLTASTGNLCIGEISAYNSGNSDTAVFQIKSKVTYASGTMTISGLFDQFTVADSSLSTTTISFNNGGSGILQLQVNGVAATNIVWGGKLTIIAS